jgi:hypothetical protein
VRILAALAKPQTRATSPIVLVIAPGGPNRAGGAATRPAPGTAISAAPMPIRH